MLLIALFTGSAWLTGCSDERTAPTKPHDPSYTQTILLMDSVAAMGNDLTANFTLRDNIAQEDSDGGILFLYGYLLPDDDINLFDRYEVENDSIAEVILGFDGAILEIELKPDKTHQDSLELDSLWNLKNGELAQIDLRNDARDSLDIILDNRYKLSVWLDDDAYEYYPNAAFLDSTVIPFLGSDMTVWGQGFYFAPANERGIRGMRMRINLSEWWVADAGWETNDPYIPDALPARGGTMPELFPIRNWLDRLTPNTTHTIHARFGAPGTRTALTASLYVVYETAQ